MDVLVKIRALMALTTSSNIDEARNAALAAVKLMQQHRVVLSLPAPNVGVTFPAPVFRTPTAPRKSGSKSKGRAKVKASPEPPVDDEWKKIKAKFDGHCKWCGKRVKKNASIFWSRENGAYHPTCYKESGV